MPVAQIRLGSIKVTWFDHRRLVFEDIHNPNCPPAIERADIMEFIDFLQQFCNQANSGEGCSVGTIGVADDYAIKSEDGPASQTGETQSQLSPSLPTVS